MSESSLYLEYGTLTAEYVDGLAILFEIRNRWGANSVTFKEEPTWLIASAEHALGSKAGSYSFTQKGIDEKGEWSLSGRFRAGHRIELHVIVSRFGKTNRSKTWDIFVHKTELEYALETLRNRFPKKPDILSNGSNVRKWSKLPFAKKA